MRSSASDSVRVAMGPRQVVLQFGNRRPHDGDGYEVDLDRQFVLPPDAAARLLSALESSLRDYEMRYGPAVEPEVDEETSQEGVPESLLNPTEGLTSSRAPTSTEGAGGDGAGLLFRLVGGLGVDYGHERSFRLREGALLANRFLLTLDPPRIPGDALARLIGICEAMGMTEELLRRTRDELPKARCVHFGFEGDGDKHLYKVYLEFPPSNDEGPFLLHRSFKWEVGSAERFVETHYLWHRGLTRAAIGDRLDAVYAAGGSEESREVAQAVLDLAASRISAEDLAYLEVREEGNERRSFDLNLYDADLRVADLQPFLTRLRRLYGIAPGLFQALYDQVKTRTAGHWAAGVHRDGGDFANVYYGAAGRRAEP